MCNSSYLQMGFLHITCEILLYMSFDFLLLNDMISISKSIKRMQHVVDFPSPSNLVVSRL
jgi:hypothetical protein